LGQGHKFFPGDLGSFGGALFLWKFSVLAEKVVLGSKGVRRWGCFGSHGDFRGYLYEAAVIPMGLP
jgi:hypothetical protein